MAAWEAIGAVSPTGLTAARLELHYAAQIASAAGVTLLEAGEDARHTNLGWDGRVGALAGHAIEGRRAGLRFADLALVVLDDGGAVQAELPLVGKTLDEGTAWLACVFRVDSLARPKHELPPHPLANETPFTGVDPPARAELARWFANADALLGDVAREHGPASPVRAWPHHFDIATTIGLEGLRTITVGLSPGDTSYAEPYFYVTPWPFPARGKTLPALPSGHWHLDGWTGAVLEGSLVARSAAQGRVASDMVRAALEGSMVLLDSRA